MNRKALIISQGQVLMVNRLIALLQKSEFEVDVVGPVVAEFELKKKDVDIFVCVTGDYVHEAQDFLAYLGEMCLSAKKPLYIVGDNKELTKVMTTIPVGVITKNVPRSVNVKDLAADIKEFDPETAMKRKEEPELPSQKQLLLVDDDLTFLRVVKNWLGMEYRVAVAHSGVQAIGWLTEHKADLILLDFDMPVMSGPQVMEALRSEPKTADIPIFFLTGKNDRDSVMSVMKLKPDGYILKSTSRENILASLQKFFGKKEM